MRNKYSGESRRGPCGDHRRRRRGSLAPLENWTRQPVRPERYIFLNILVTLRNRLVTQACRLLSCLLPITYPLLTRSRSRGVYGSTRYSAAPLSPPLPPPPLMAGVNYRMLRTNESRAHPRDMRNALSVTSRRDCTRTSLARFIRAGNSGDKISRSVLRSNYTS